MTGSTFKAVDDSIGCIASWLFINVADGSDLNGIRCGRDTTGIIFKAIRRTVSVFVAFGLTVFFR